MLCSISTGKSGSNWLDRLRSSKGFPSGDDLDLDHFLHNPKPNPNLSDSSDTNLSGSVSNQIDVNSSSNLTQLGKKSVLDRKKMAETPNGNGEDLLGVMSDVLEELFNMGGSDDFPRTNGKRSCRKQPNPRICVVPNVAERCSEGGGSGSATLRSSGNNNCMETRQKSDHVEKQKSVETRRKSDRVVNLEEEERSRADLSTFSRMQVTVIDTSCPNWKIQKFLFRRKNVWKVKDKKYQAVSVFKQKRKASPLDGEKEPKNSTGKCSSSTKEAKRKESVAPSIEGQRKGDKREEAHGQTLNVLSQVSKTRFPRKPEKADSSVVLIKSLPTSKKHGTKQS